MRVDLRRFKASRVSVGGLGVSGKVDEPEGPFSVPMDSFWIDGVS